LRRRHPARGLPDEPEAPVPAPRAQLPPKRSSYEALHQTLFELIDNAVDAHQQAAETAGKAPADAPKLSATSS